MPDIYFPDTKSKAVFSADGPKPQFLLDAPQFKALVVGLEAGQQLPVHPAEAAMYHFLAILFKRLRGRYARRT